MKKLRKMKSLRNEATQVFNEYIRRRDADKNGVNTCVTCGKREHYSNMNASHFYHGKNWQSALDERNVFPACRGCNLYKHGNLIEYGEFLRKKFGSEIIDILRELRHQGWKPSRQELEDIIETYKKKLEGLK